MSPAHTLLTPARRVRVLTVGIAAAFSLYSFVLLLGEPTFHSLVSRAAQATGQTVVSMVVSSSITNTCTSAVNIGTINGTGDTSSNDGYDSADSATCTVSTNNTTGYTFA